MSTRDRILREARDGHRLKSSVLASEFGVSRQTVAHHLRQLVDEGVLEKTGSTKNATYALVIPDPRATALTAPPGIGGDSAHSIAPAGSRLPGLRLLLAAGVAAVVIGVSLLAPRTEPDESASRSIVGGALRGRQTFQAETSLSADRAHLEAGSEITLQAGELVVLGEGFTVDHDAELTVKIEDEERVGDTTGPSRG